MGLWALFADMQPGTKQWWWNEGNGAYKVQRFIGLKVYWFKGLKV